MARGILLCLERALIQGDGRAAAGTALGIGRTDPGKGTDIALVGRDPGGPALFSQDGQVFASGQGTAADGDAGILFRIQDRYRGAQIHTAQAGRSRRNLGIGLAIRAEVQRICRGDGSVRHRHLGALGIALAGRSGDAGSIGALDARIRIVEGVLDHLAAGCSAIGSGRLLSIQGRIGLLQHSGGIKGSPFVIAAAVGICQFGADGGHHHVGIDAQATYCGAHQVLIHVQFFPGGNSRFPGRDGALVHLGQDGGADGVHTHARSNGGTACTETGRIELRGHLIVGVHGEVLIGRHFAVVHHCRSLAVHIVDRNGRSSSPHGTGHAGHHCGHTCAAVRRHIHGTGIAQAAVFLRRNRAARQFCIRGEVIIDHAHASSHGAGDHGRTDSCRSADQGGLVVVFGRDFQSLVGTGDVLHGGSHGAIQSGGRCRCCCGTCTVDPSSPGHTVRVGDHRGLLVRRYSHIPAVDGLLRRIRAAQFRSRIPAQEQGIRSRADTGPAIGADAHGQGAHMAFALRHILSLYGHVVGRAVIEIFIDVRISHRRPGGAANVVDGHRAGCAHGHIVGAGQTGRQGHALQIMLTGSFYSHAFLLVADRFGLLALCFQGAAFHGAFRIARDGIVADAHAETGIASRAAHGPGKVRQVFFAVCQYTDVAAARNGAARHNGLHIVANLVHGNVAGQGCLTGHGRAKTDGRNGRVACCLHGGMLVFDRTAAHGSRGILVNPVHADTGTAGKITAAGADNGQGVNLALAVRFNRHRGPFVRILVNHAVLYFRRHGLIDKSRGSCALHGHLAGTAHAHSGRGQGGTIHRLYGRTPAGHMGQGGLVQGRPGLLAGTLRAGGSAAHIVVGYGAAQGHLAAGTDIAGSSHPHIVAFGFHFHSFGIGHCSIFYRIGPVFRAHFPYCGFRVTAAVVHHHGAVYRCLLAGGHGCSKAVDFARILACDVHAHPGGGRFRRHAAAGQVGADVVVQAIVGQGGPDACRLAVGHGTGHVHGLGIAGRMHLQIVRGQGGIRHLGLDPVVLILPGHAAHPAEVLGTGGHTGGHVYCQAVRFGLGSDGTRRQGGAIDLGRKGIVQVGHVHGCAGCIVLGAGHHKGGTHTEAALVAVEVHFFTGRIQAVAAVGGLVIGRTIRIHPCILEQAFLHPIGAQLILIPLGLIRTAGGIVGFHGDGICRDAGTIGNIRTHRIVQPVVEHGTGEGVVRAVAAHGHAGRDGRRNLFGGQETLHLGIPDVGIGTAVDPGFQVVVDVGHSQAAAGRVATADGHVRIDAAGNLQVAFVGRHVDVCFFRGRFPGHRIVFRQGLDVFVNQVHRSRSPAGKVIAGLAALREGQGRAGRHGRTAAQGFDVQALHPGQGAVAHGSFNGIVDGVHAHGTTEGHTGVVLTALALAQGNGRTAAVSPHIGRIPGAHAHGPVVIEFHRGSVHHCLGGIIHQVQGKAPGPGQAEGRRRIRLGGHCGLGTALALAAGVHPGDGILHFIRNSPDGIGDGPHRIRHLAEQVAHGAHAALFRLAFFRFRAAGGHTSGHADGVHQAGGLCIYLEGGCFDLSFVIVIIGGGNVFHGSPVGHVDVVHRHGDPGRDCPVGRGQGQDGIVHIGIVVPGDGNAALMVFGLIFHGLQQGVLIHQHLVGAVAVAQGHHAADGRAIRLAGRQHDPGMEHVGAALQGHIPSSQAGTLVHLDQRIIVEILIVETAADSHAVRFAGGRIVQPQFALAGHGHIFDGFIGLQVQGIASRQLGISPHLHLAVEVEIRNGNGSRRGYCRVLAALGRSCCRDVGIVVGAQVFHGRTDHVQGAGQQVRDLFLHLFLGLEERILGLDIRIEFHGRVLQFQELIVQIPAGGCQIRHFVEGSFCSQVRPIGGMLQIVLVERDTHIFQFPFQGHQIIIDGFQVTEFTEIGQLLPVLHLFGCRFHGLEAVIQPLLDFLHSVVIHPGAGLEGKVLPCLQLGLFVLRPVFHRHPGRILHAAEHGPHGNGHRIGITVRVLEGAGDTGSGQQSIIHRIVGGSLQGAVLGFRYRILAEIHPGRGRFVGHGDGGTCGQGVPQGIRQRFRAGGAAGSRRTRILGSLAQGVLHQGIFLDFPYDALHIGGLHDPLHELGLELALAQVVVGAVGIFRRMVGCRKGHILVRLRRSLHVDGSIALVGNHIHGCRAHGGIRCLGGCRRIQALGGVSVHLHAALIGFCRTVHLDLGIVVAVRHRHSGHQAGRTGTQHAGTDHGIGAVGHRRRGVCFHLQGFLFIAVAVFGILAGGLHLAVNLDGGLVVRLGIAHPGGRDLAGDLFEIFLAGSHRTSGAVQVGLGFCLHRIPGDRGILPDGDTGFVFEQHHIGAHWHHVADGIPQFIRDGIAAVHVSVVGAGLHVHGTLGRHIPLHIHFGHGLGIAAGIAGIGFLPFLEIAVGGFGSQGGIPGSFHGTIVLHTGGDGLGDIDVRAAQKPGGVHQSIEGLIQAVGRVGPGGQDHIPAAVLRSSQLGEIGNPGGDGCALFDAVGRRTVDGLSGQVPAHSHLAGIELHIMGGVDLAQHADGTAGIDPDVGSPVFDGVQFRIPIGTVGKFPLQDFIGSLILIREILGPGRSHHIESPRIDDTALAHGHAAGAQEEQVAADLLVADGVQGPIDVDAGIHEVQQVLGFPTVLFRMEIQVGCLAGIQLEFLELVDGIVLAVVLLGVDIEYPILVRRIVLPVGSGDAPGQGGQGLAGKAGAQAGSQDSPAQVILFHSFVRFLMFVSIQGTHGCPPLKLSVDGEMDPSPALFFSVDGPLQRKAQGHVQGNFLRQVRFDPHAGTHQAPVSKGAAAPDPAPVQEQVPVHFSLFIQGYTVFGAGGEASIPADQAFRIAPHAVHAPQIEHFTAGQVLGAGQLAVQTEGPLLAGFVGFLVQAVEFVFAEVPVVVVQVLVPAHPVSVFLVQHGGISVVQLVVVQKARIHRIVHPVCPQAQAGAEVGLRPLVAVFKSPFGLFPFRGLDGSDQEGCGHVGMAPYPQCFEGAVGDMHAVGAVAEARPGPRPVDGGTVAAGHGFHPFRPDGAEEQMVPVPGKIPVLPEQTGPVQAAGLAAGVVKEHPGHLFLGFLHCNHVVRGARFLPGFQGDPQLGIIGGVEPEQVFVQSVHGGNLAGFDVEPVRNVFLPGAPVADDFHLAVLPFHQVDLDPAVPDGLRRQEGPAGQIAFFLVQGVDLAHQGIQVIQGSVLPLICSGDLLQFFLGKNLGFRQFHLLQQEVDGTLLCFFRTFRPFHRLGIPPFLDFPGDALSFQVLAGAVQFHPAVVVSGRMGRGIGCCGGCPQAGSSQQRQQDTCCQSMVHHKSSPLSKLGFRS